MTTRAITKHNKTRVWVLAASLILVATACGDDGEDGGDLQWFQTCGDPVCGTYNPTPGATICTDEMAGDSCSPDGASCEVADDTCNTDLLCSDSDPKTAGCPISRRQAKRDIAYLNRAERDRLAGELLQTRLATYRYRAEPATATPRLGFIIDDQPGSPAVRPGAQRVDLYGYTSMAVAAIQAQAATIAQLEARVAELESELKALSTASAKSN